MSPAFAGWDLQFRDVPAARPRIRGLQAVECSSHERQQRMASRTLKRLAIVIW
jgi:hypothetical protein